MEDTEAARHCLHQLKDIGVRISIDDFGTGHSCLNYLRRFPIDVLKIDRSLVSGVCDNPDDTAVASAIIAFGRTLGLKIVAQGVETVEQVRLLRDQGCNMIQGHFVGKPLPANKFASCIRRSTVGSALPAFVT